jgi:hypothetical protein
VKPSTSRHAVASGPPRDAERARPRGPGRPVGSEPGGFRLVAGARVAARSPAARAGGGSVRGGGRTFGRRVGERGDGGDRIDARQLNFSAPSESSVAKTTSCHTGASLRPKTMPHLHVSSTQIVESQDRIMVFHMKMFRLSVDAKNPETARTRDARHQFGCACDQCVSWQFERDVEGTGRRRQSIVR